MKHINRCRDIEIDLPLEQAFYLFTPEGEKEWIDGWDPEYLFPADGELREGMVFSTTHGGELTLWACTDLKRENHHVTYARVTPGSRFGFVKVACQSKSANVTNVRIRYEYTALSLDGEKKLDEISENAFDNMIADWNNRIVAWRQNFMQSGFAH